MLAKSNEGRLANVEHQLDALLEESQERPLHMALAVLCSGGSMGGARRRSKPRI